MKIVRSLLALVVGYSTAALTAGTVGAILFSAEASSPLLWRLFPGLVFLVFGGLAAGYLVAAIAGRAPLGHAAVVAGITAVAGIVTLIDPIAPEPNWFLLLGTALEVAAVLVGAYLTSWTSRLAEDAP